MVTLLLIRWGLFRQIGKIVDWAKAVRTGKYFKPEPHLDILDPLHREIEYMAKIMNEAKATAEEEARLRAEEEARKRAGEEARKKAEEEARLRAAEEARKRAAGEARKKDRKSVV